MNFAKIKHYDIANGEGIRISLFVSGCKFHCEGCFNPETWNFNYGNKYTDETKNELIKLISSPNIDGLSLLGGDPLWQSDEDLLQLIELCQEIKKLNKSIWIWTGFKWEDIFSTGTKYQKDLISCCNVLVDGQFILEQRDLKLKWKGSKNQRVINISESLNKNEIILYES